MPALLRAGVASTVIGMLTLNTGAMAQEQPAAAPEAATIIVTGSLIRNPNLKSATPVNVTTAEEVELRQVTGAEQLLREIPGVVPSIGSAVNNGNGGSSFTDLRGLGSNRNVVLLDGVRVVPVDLVGRFDLNNVPVALLERVDVLTGGASTTYGADAISGVINFITKSDFAGLQVDASTQILDAGDGNTVRLDVTTGANFDDGRGNVVLSIGYQQADPVYQGARKIGQNTINTANGASSGSGTTVPSQFNFGFGLRQIAPDGQSLVGSYAPFNFAPYNIFQTPFERFNIYAAGRYEISDAVEVYSRGMFNKISVGTIIAPSGSFGRNVEIPLSNPYLPTGIRSQLCNTYDFNSMMEGQQGLTAAQCQAAAMATDPKDPNYRSVKGTMNRRAVEAGPRTSDYNTTMFDYRLGFRGGITDTINWDVFGSYGESHKIETTGGYLINERIENSLLATNKETCLTGGDSCVPINWFTPTAGGVSPEGAAYLQASSVTQTKVSLAQARAMIDGDFGVTSPWASQPISFAVGGEYRKYAAEQIPDDYALTGNLAGSGGPTPAVNGGFDIYEAIGELIIPIISDRPLFEDLTLQGGLRYSSYSVDAPTSPSYKTTTWNVKGTWTPVNGLTLRASYARAVRAPNISELFSPVTTGLVNLDADPCASITDEGTRFSPGPTGVLRDVCLAQGATTSNVNNINHPTAGQANQTSGGNLNVGPEKSTSYILGGYFTPSFAPGLSVSLDYYNIKITGAITEPEVDDVLNACFGAGNLSASNPACLGIRRNPVTGGLDGDPTTTPGVPLQLTNQGRLATDGIDLSLHYRTDIGFAKLISAITGNWTNKSVFQASPSATPRDCIGRYGQNCGSLQPKFQWTMRTTLSFETMDHSLAWRHLHKFTSEFNNFFVGVPFGYTNDQNFNKIPSYDYFDWTSRFNVSDNVTLVLSVQNMFNKKPPLVGSNAGEQAYNSGNTFPSTFDALGRRYGAAVKFRF